MICILLNKEDVAGLKLSRLLQKAGRTDIKLIAAEELVYAPSFSCGIRNGKAFFSLQLTDGFVFSNETVSAVINRIQRLPSGHIQRFAAADRDYVKAELDAIFVFLFSILPNSIFNKSTPAGFCGRHRSAAEWQLLAGQSGFATGEMLYQHKQLQTSAVPAGKIKTLLSFRGGCYGSAAVDHTAAAQCCTKLGQLAGENILEIKFWEDDGQLVFASAATQPSFENLDADFINAINSLL